ncbi:hypothetical protein EMIT0373P_40473 [Pseudomonas chlororaphis]
MVPRFLIGRPNEIRVGHFQCALAIVPKQGLFVVHQIGIIAPLNWCFPTFAKRSTW